MKSEKASGKIDILAVTSDYLKGKISFEEYSNFETQWIDRYSRPKPAKSGEEPPKDLRRSK